MKANFVPACLLKGKFKMNKDMPKRGSFKVFYHIYKCSMCPLSAAR